MYLKKSENLGKIVEVTQEEKYSFTPEENSMKNFSQKQLTNEHETAPEKNGSNTVLLSDYVRLNENKELKLVPVTRSGMCDAQREVIVVKEFPWVIGSMKNYCNTVLDDDLVSRIHLSIYRENEEYYIEDMNSTNGTFLNDERLQPQSRCKLKAQDCITIADRSYRVEKELPLF
jgi:pSer/pThr/pTyr-binding forkhead associated (FHA) protein